MKTDLGAALAAGATLPADWYADPAIQRLEGERIFARTWQYAGPGRPGRESRRLLHVLRRPDPDRGRPRHRGRPARLRQRLPPSRPPDRAGRREPQGAPVPVPRLDVRPRRHAAQGAPLGAGARLRQGGLLDAPGGHRGLGAARLRQPRSRRRPARRRARAAARPRRRERRRPRPPALPRPQRLGDRVRLEGRDRELPRVLPLRGRAPGLLEGDRRRPRRVPATRRRGSS